MDRTAWDARRLVGKICSLSVSEVGCTVGLVELTSDVPADLAAVAFASAGSGMHHKICHVLGGTWNMPHAQTHATVLPYVLAFNAPEAPDAAARIAAAPPTPLRTFTGLCGYLRRSWGRGWVGTGRWGIAPS